MLAGDDDRVRPRDTALATLVAVIWGINFLAVDRGLQDLPPFAFVALRFVFVALPAVFFVPRPRIGFWRVVAIGATISAGQFGLLFLGMHLGAPTGLAPIVLQAQVLFTVVLSALFLRERPTGGQLVGVLVGAAGLAVVAVGRAAVAPVLPLLIVVGAAASWAVGNTLTRGVKASGLSLTIWSGLVVPVPLALMSVIFEGPTAMVDAVAGISGGGILALAYTVLGASLVGYGIWNTLLSKYPTASVGPFAMLVPVVGVLAAWIALDELPTPTEAIGAVILLIGVAATVVLGRRRSRLSARSDRTSTVAGIEAAEPGGTGPVGAVRHSDDAPVWDTGSR